MNNISVGDVVLSTAGRDKGKCMIVVDVNVKDIYVVDGKIRKVSALKKKNPKHLKKVKDLACIELAERIRNKKAVGNDRVKKALKDVVNKKEEK